MMTGMATIVRHTERDALFLLVGAGYGTFLSAMPDRRFGNLVADTEEGEVPMIAVCDLHGKVGFVAADNVEVVSIDGREPGELLREAQNSLADES